MPHLPPDIETVIAAYSGRLRFGGAFSQWRSLSDWRQLPEVGGVYALGLTLGVQYDLAVSRIIYVGSTINLRLRSSNHNTGSHSNYIQHLARRYPGGLIWTHFALPQVAIDWLRAIEDAVLQACKLKLGCYPVCNQGAIGTVYASECRGLVEVHPCTNMPFPVALETFALHFGVKSVGNLREWKPPKERSEASVSEEPADRRDNRRVANLTYVGQDTVATWNLEKFLALTAICRELKARKSKSKVHVFEAASREIPKPHTWGEVALIQGRTVAGSWLPATKGWVKVQYGKELLGQSVLEDAFYVGEDMSDVPQIKKQRPSIWKDAEWLKEYKLVRGELPSSFGQPAGPMTEVPDVKDVSPVVAEHLRLLRASRSLDLEVANQKLRFESKNAIKYDRDRKAREILQARIEERYQAAITT